MFLQRLLLHFFFFQAEDGIRDGHVTGVQTCALPISSAHRRRMWRPSTPPAGLPGSAWRRCWRPSSDRKSTRLNSSHVAISYAVFCLKKKTYGMQGFVLLVVGADYHRHRSVLVYCVFI